MSRYPFQKAQFIKTAIWPKDYPNLKDPSGKAFPEIAVAGRSNVGKSTLLNHLFQRKNLVKTSSTPGKTQAINFFTVDEALTFVDLPGYGFAKVPAHIKKQWAPMIESYLDNRPSMILFLIDIRRIPNDDDRIMLDWAYHRNIPLVLVITKIDKIKKNAKKAHLEKIFQALQYDEIPYVTYSATKNQGRQELLHLIHNELQEAKESK